MSLATWRSRYMPVEADRATADDVTACKHSLRKWVGLRTANLAAHEVRWTQHPGGDILASKGRGRLHVGAVTCALCVRGGMLNCGTCQLARVRGGMPCDYARSDEIQSPYALRQRDPEIMIGWLRKALWLARDEARKAKTMIPKSVSGSKISGSFRAWTSDV